MAETAPAAAKKKQKKAGGVGKAKNPTDPKVSDLILKAVTASKERKGISQAAVKKALAADGYDVEKNRSRVKITLKGLVTRGALSQLKGTGASGFFKLSKKPSKTKTKPAKKAAGAAVAKAKKPKKAATTIVGGEEEPQEGEEASSRLEPQKPKAAKKSPTKVVKPKAAKPKAAAAKK